MENSSTTALVKKNYRNHKRFTFIGALQVLGIPKEEFIDRTGHVYTKQEIIDICGGKSAVWEWALHHYRRTTMLIHQRHFNDKPMYNECMQYVNRAKEWIFENLFTEYVAKRKLLSLRSSMNILGMAKYRNLRDTRKFDHDEVHRLYYAQGWTRKKIQKLLGSHYSTVYRLTANAR